MSSGQQWSCDRCTLQQSATAQQCELCEFPNPFIVTQEEKLALAIQMSKADEVKYDTNEDHIAIQLNKEDNKQETQCILKHSTNDIASFLSDMS